MGIVGDAAAASAERISRTEHHRVADLIGKCQAVVHIFHDQGSRNRLSDLLHGGLELQTVLSLFDRLRCGPDEAHAVFFQESGLFELHGKVQARLAAQGREHAVRLLFQDELLNHLYGQRLNIYTVRDVFICHDGRRVGV